MKRLMIILICLLSAAQLFAQYPTQLNHHASIDFGATVDIKKEKEETYFFAPLDEAAKIIELAHVLDLNSLHVDTSFFKDSYNDSMVSALIIHNLPTQIEGMKLDSKKMITFGKSRGMDFVYKITKSEDGLPSRYLYLRVLMANHELYYLFVFLADADTQSLKVKDHFFNSLKIN